MRKFNTAKIEIAGKVYTATEPCIAALEAFDEAVASLEGGKVRPVKTLSAMADFVAAALQDEHPEVKAADLKKKLRKAELTAAFAEVMKLATGKESEPGEG
jgi:hypothetical protein